MEKNQFKYFPAKVLLFGEYTALLQSDILAVPLERFQGSWKFKRGTDNKVLVSLGRYLEKSAFSGLFDRDLFLKDLEHGLYFDSDIKPGFGIGSSGALSAAVFYRYYRHEYATLEKLKEILASIESFFHGTSSGIDPLVSYMHKGVYSAKNKITVVDPAYNGKNYFSLLDSGIRRSTGKFVAIFKEKQKNPVFLKKALMPLTKLNNTIIKEYLDKKDENVFELFHKISQIQFDFFKEMIPGKLLDIWEKSLSLPDMKIKLCGAGGGGYFLIVSKDKRLPGWVKEQFEIIENI